MVRPPVPHPLSMPREPFRWDFPSLAYDSGDVLWDGELPRRPRPRGGRSAASPTPPPAPVPVLPSMNTFQYHPFPLSSGGFTTRLVFGPEIDVPALDAAVAAEAGVTPEKATLVLQSYLRRILAAGATGGQSTDIHGLLRFRATSGGSQPGPDDFHSPDDLNADVGLSFTKEAIRQWRTTLTLESMGLVGKVTPIVDGIFNMVNDASNQYTPGGLIQLRGDNLKFDKTDNAQGVFLQPAAGAEVRATSYGTIDPTNVILNVPAALSGPLTVRVAAYLNGSVRSFTYSIPITT